MLQGEQRKEGRFEDVSRWCGDGGGDVEGEISSEEEFLMGLESHADLLRKGRSRRVVRRRREGDIDGVSLEREDDASYVEEGRFVVVRVAKEGA